MSEKWSNVAVDEGILIKYSDKKFFICTLLINYLNLKIFYDISEVGSFCSCKRKWYLLSLTPQTLEQVPLTFTRKGRKSNLCNIISLLMKASRNVQNYLHNNNQILTGNIRTTLNLCLVSNTIS
jgi:hypothetical protein